MSRYATYAALIADIAQEVGESGSELDALILNLCQSVIDQLNTVRCPFREASASVPFVAGTFQYSLATIASDFNEVVDRKTSLYYSDTLGRTFIPITSSRSDFLQGVDVTVQGTPSMARIFAGNLEVRPTPNATLTATLEYYKNLASPTTTGAVLIPDPYLSALRMLMLERVEAYHESNNFAGKQAVFNGIRLALMAAIHRDFQQNSLPAEVDMADAYDL